MDLSRFDFKVFGFDVRATDRDGAADGLTSIANVFVRTVYVSKINFVDTLPMSFNIFLESSSFMNLFRR